MKFQLRLPWRQAEPKPVDPGGPHPFRQIDDFGIAVLASGASATYAYGGLSGPVALADNFIRKQRCGVPGCGRERHDPIHEQPAD